jgi:predicted RNase H-like HicB family nuclease
VWVAKSALLPDCHAYGRDRGEVLLRFQEAAKAHLQALPETGRPIPPAFHEKFVLVGWHGQVPSYNYRKLERRLRELGCRLIRGNPTPGGASSRQRPIIAEVDRSV